MTRSKLGLLGVCAVVLGLMTFSATAAHAEPGAQWLLAKLLTLNDPKTLDLIPFLPATVELEAESVGVLHSKIAGIAVLFECSKLTAIKAMLIENGSIGEAKEKASGSKIKFSECITKLNGATSAACKPNAGGTESGVINTNAGHGLIVLHELSGGVKDDLVKILPDSGETFATIEMGAECAIGTKVPVIGKATLKDCEGLALSHLLRHLVETGPLTELWVISKTAEHVASILGSAWAFLGGEHKGLHFSGDPA